MVWVFFIGVAVLVVAATAALALGRVAVDPVPPPVTSTPALELDLHPRAADIDGIRFDTALRGYRMDQVDEALDVLYARIVELEQQVAPTPDEAHPQPVAEGREEPHP